MPTLTGPGAGTLNSTFAFVDSPFLDLSPLLDGITLSLEGSPIPIEGALQEQCDR